MNRADWHAHWEPKPPTRPNPSKPEEIGISRERLSSLFIGVVGILLVAFALLVVLPVAK